MVDYPVPTPDSENERQHRRELARVVANAMAGRLNCVIEVTLTANTTTTTVTDARLTFSAAALFDPVTANAAAELAAGTLYATAANRNNGAWTLTHANSAQTDRTFRMLVIG